MKQRGSAEAPQVRQHLADRHRERRLWLAEHAPLLGKWLWLLFWLIVPNLIAGVLTMDAVAELVPAVKPVGEGLKAVVALLYGLILLKLTAVSQRFRIAGWCFLAGSAFSFAALLFGMTQDGALWWILAVPMAVVELVGAYQEFAAYSEILEGLNEELSGKWKTLWKWYIGCMIALPCSALVVLISAILGLLVILAAAVGLIVVGVLNMVYQYRTAKLFRDYAPQCGEEMPV